MRHVLLPSYLVLIASISGCRLPSTRSDQPQPYAVAPSKHHFESCRNTLVANPPSRSVITIQGPEIPSKSVVIPATGVTLSEALIHYAKSREVASILTAYRRTELPNQSPGLVANIRKENSEFALNLLKSLPTHKAPDQSSTLLSVDSLQSAFVKAFEFEELKPFHSELSVGLVTYLERTGLREADQFLKSLQACEKELQEDNSFSAEDRTKLLLASQLAIKAIDTKDAAALRDAMDTLNATPHMQQFINPYQSLSREQLQSILNQPEELSRFCTQLAQSVDQNASSQFSTDIGLLKPGSTTTSSPTETIRNALATRILTWLNEERINIEWLAKALAVAVVNQGLDRSRVQLALEKMLVSNSKQTNSSARFVRSQSAVFQSDPMSFESEEQGGIILTKTDGTQLIMSWPTAIASPLGGVLVEDSDAITLVRWEQIPFPQGDTNYTISKVLDLTEKAKLDWQDVAIIELEIFGKSSQLFVPLNAIHSGSFPMHSIVSDQASFSYGNLSTLPVVIESRLLIEHRLRGNHENNHQ